jgi:hypothetical protein
MTWCLSSYDVAIRSPSTSLEKILLYLVCRLVMEKGCVSFSIIEHAHGSQGPEVVEVALVEFIISDPPGAVAVNAALIDFWK